MNAAGWHSYFECNLRREQLTPPRTWPESEQASPTVLKAVARTLTRFYLGETGEGTVALQAQHEGLDHDWVESIRLYVAEEHRHGAEVLLLLAALGNLEPKRHWSEALFRHGRRALGFRTKMLTIAAAEVVGVEMYGLLRDHVPGPVGTLGAVIAQEELSHLRFQRDFFRHQLSKANSLERTVTTIGFSAITACAIATFLLDHASLLRALEVSRRQVIKRCVHQMVDHLPLQIPASRD